MVPVLAPPATIGMLGGGQLGRYALMAAASMGYRTVVLDPDPSAPAGVISGEHLVAAYDDESALRRLQLDADVVTTEFENPPATSLDLLAGVVPVFPRPSAVAIAQDRIAEKSFLVENGFPVGPHLAIRADSSGAAVDDAAIASLLTDGAIVKTARLGYDGKGQAPVEAGGGVAGVLAGIAELGGVDVVVEARLRLRTEVSVLVARTADGAEATWPVSENAHAGGILDVSVVPATVGPELTDRATGLAMAIADALDYVGVLAVEMFVVDDDLGEHTLLINELAPRPHNSGHWTLDAAATNQFEQQIRAVCGLPLGATDLTAPAVAMVNLLGDLWFDTDGRRRSPDWAAALESPHAWLHLYGKAEPRPGRKMGHLTVVADDAIAARARALALRAAAVR
ncbi:MAG: 5-(carboxyamino)imidazole ribonucleotide synthase [Actinomycetota bacterium]